MILAGSAWAQDKTTTDLAKTKVGDIYVDGKLVVPTLTDVEKLQLQNALQQVEIATLRAQALLKKFEKEGYTLDLQSLTYTKNEVPKK